MLYSDNTSFDNDGTFSITQGKLHFLLAGGETIRFFAFTVIRQVYKVNAY